MKPAIDQAIKRLYLKGHTHGHGTASITAPLLRFTRARELWAHNGFLLNDLKILRRMTSNFGDKMGDKKRRGWNFLFSFFLCFYCGVLVDRSPGGRIKWKWTVGLGIFVFYFGAGNDPSRYAGDMREP